MKANLIFRCLYYFRQGWAGYFVFIFSALNTLTVTYYLAIEKIPAIKEVFPSFFIYIIFAVSVGIPLLTMVGYAHFKKSYAFKAEADVSIEENMHTRRMLENTETLLSINFKLNELVFKILKNEKLTDEEIVQINQFQQQLSEHMKNRTLD
jgi:hypothetical protein